MNAPATERPALVERLHRFVDELRVRGLPVSLVERIDALAAVELIELDAPRSLHTALSATLVKTVEHQAVFDEVFGLYFRNDQPPGPRPPTDPLPFDLDHAVRVVLTEGSEILARLVAEQAVAQYAQFEPGHPVAGVLYESRTMRGLRLDQISAGLLAGQDGGVGDEAGAGDAAGAAGGSGSAGLGRQLGLTLFRDEVASRVELLRAQVREVIRELLVTDRGPAAVAGALRTPVPENVVLASASAAQLAEIARVLAPLQRKLATSMLRRRRSRRGPLDVRATLRASMATGGVPVRISYRRPTPTKPKLIVLADLSGSVANYAAFTIMLVCGLTQMFSQLRVFAFVENAVEVTELFRTADDPITAVRSLNQLGGLNFLDASTDYGRALRQCWAEVGPTLGRRHTVLIFGDGRGNYRPAESGALAHLAHNAGALYWLNPEQTRYWGTGDSLMSVYGPLCTEALSCRTLAELRAFVERLD